MTMRITDPTAAALVAHIAAQTTSNLNLLVSRNYLQLSDVETILTRLASLETYSAVDSVAGDAQHLSLHDSDASITFPRSSSPPKAVMPAQRHAQPLSSSRAQAKALWDYNLQGTDPDDLSFHAGDFIEIVSETNTDWWTGKLNGLQGLFPSNYVEKLPSHKPVASPPSPSRAPIPVPAPTGAPLSNGAHYAPCYSLAPAYNVTSPPPPPFVPQQGQYGTPPPKMGQSPHGPPPPTPYGGFSAPVPPPIIAPPPPGPKKRKFGGLGNTMATAAAGGLGFGAGSAIGADMVNSIF